MPSLINWGSYDYTYKQALKDNKSSYRCKKRKICKTLVTINNEYLNNNNNNNINHNNINFILNKEHTCKTEQEIINIENNYTINNLNYINLEKRPKN